MRRLGFTILAALAGLLALAPRVEGARSPPPRIDPASIRHTDAGAFATTDDGATAELTLNAALDRAAERLLRRAGPRRGAVVAVSPRTGDVLAWAGVEDGRPDRAVPATALAPAASLFKLVTATALLERHVGPSAEVCVAGGNQGIAERHLERPRVGDALCGPFREALGKSRNAVFAQLASRVLDPDRLGVTATRLGFGASLGTEIPASLGDLTLPSDRLGFARAAAGFVGSRLSPVGALHLTTAIARLGEAARLRLVRSAPGYSSRRRAEPAGRLMSEGVARELVRMMEFTTRGGTTLDVFATPEGQSHLGDLRVASKTGTLREGTDRTASWFVGFAPSRAPELAVAVLLENPDRFRQRAAEVGRDLLRVHFAERGARGVTAPDGI